MCQCRFIGYNKCTVWGGTLTMREALCAYVCCVCVCVYVCLCVCVGGDRAGKEYVENLYLLLNFDVNLKLLFKNKY